jgi:hypothetical protein
MEIGDYVKLESKRGDAAPKEPGVIVGFVVHYPNCPPHLAFRDEATLLEPHEVPESLRSKQSALINGAEGVFEEALRKPVQEVVDRILKDEKDSEDD